MLLKRRVSRVGVLGASQKQEVGKLNSFKLIPLHYKQVAA